MNQDLLRRVVDGDPAAWHQLFLEAHALVQKRIKHHPAMRNRFRAHAADHTLNVALKVMERLHGHGETKFECIGAFLESSATRDHSDFKAWLFTTTDYAVLDYVRQKYGESTQAPSHRRAVDSLAIMFGEPSEALRRKLEQAGGRSDSLLLEFFDAHRRTLNGLREQRELDREQERAAPRPVAG